MLRFVASRLLQAVPVLLGVTLVAFLAIHLVPGDPVRIMLQGRASDAAVAEIHARLGMDKPLLVQYARFVGNALTGDLGTSIIQRAPVAAIVWERLVPSVFLLAYATLLSVLMAVPLAVWAAARRQRLADHLIRLSGTVAFAMPSFWIGLILILGFGLTLKWFPIAGFGKGFGGHVHHLFLPALTIALFLAPLLIQSLRAAMLDAMTAEHVEVARAKGLSESRVLFKYVLRAAAIPVITILAVNIGWLISGSVVVESVFSVAGLGMLLVHAVSTRDYPVIQGLTVVFALLVLGVNLLADLAHALIDRRVRP
ncbi:MAG: ABC transporter permease [Rhodocyclaceae bacterium]|nr:ABC transporter permease [Rhodocyclaceae bacterium]MCA3135225.1 ABC transporter permease [Rhodocyclaceae bacterium]MCA3142724.1 ABC transporter permease [Rhodocyclaceae bacterium]MCA3145257.1 ABC transporter permease [Rhodocyclaceae bacterium]